MKTDDDGAMGQVKAMYTDSMVKDENKAKKGMEAYSDDNKKEIKIEEVILSSKIQSHLCEFATPAARTGAEGVPAGLCGPSGSSALSTHLAF